MKLSTRPAVARIVAVAATGLALTLGGVGGAAGIAGAQTYPVHNGTLSVDGGAPGSTTTPTYAAGQPRHLKGSGFQPGATVTITIESVPVTLGTTTADPAGVIDVTVTIPTDFPAGSHTLKATGSAPDGGVLVLAQPVQVTPAGPTGATTTTSGGGGGTTATTVAGDPPSNLARTGRDVRPLALGGVAIVLAGGGLVVVAGRRRHDAA